VVQISKALHSSIGLLFVVSFVNKFKCFFHAGQRLLISIMGSGMLNEGSNIVVRISVGDLFGTIGGTGRFSQSEPFYSFCPSLFDFCRRPNQSALFSISPFLSLCLPLLRIAGTFTRDYRLISRSGYVFVPPTSIFYAPFCSSSASRIVCEKYQNQNASESGYKFRFALVD
jgi:hypothetical protein